MQTPTPKIAILGAGSFVFTQRLLHDLIVRNRLAGAELVLVDVDAAMAETMAQIAQRMAADSGVDLHISGTADRRLALRSAQFVTCSVAAQLLARYRTDREILARHGLKEMSAECGGLGGLSYTLRQVALVMAFVHDMEELCPEAWLLNVSNPLPRVMTAVSRYSRIRGVGFCNAAWGAADGYAAVGRMLGRNYHELDVVSAGLNHFAWVLAVRDRKTDADLLPALRDAVARGASPDGPLSNKWARQFGCVLLAGDSHAGEFLPWDEELGHEHIAHHGDPAERAARRTALEEAAAGKRPWQPLMAGGSWERPGDVIHALVTGQDLHLDMVNVPNRGAVASLPEDAIVEVPAEIASGTLAARVVGELPGPVAEICRRVSRVHDLAAAAAHTGCLDTLDECIATDPAIGNKSAARQAIREMLRAHRDLLPPFAPHL